MIRDDASGRLRYSMPAEWEGHDATWLAWPKDPLTFPEGTLERVERIYAKMIGALTTGEMVDLLVDDEETQQRAASLLRHNRRVRYHLIKTADVWIRDYGPIFVRNATGGLAAVKWIFNAWGNKYEELKRDNESGLAVAEETGLQTIQPGMVFEGGSIDANGLGTCLTTEQCLLNENRNPGLGRDAIERRLERYLGVTNVVWLSHGIAGDDTDGHVDDLARFVGPSTVICMAEDDPGDENYAALRENARILRSAADQNGRKLKVIPIAMPEKKVGGDERLPASYANFYIGNRVVLVPTFADVNDSPALRAISGAFPTRKVVGIDCEPLVYGFGGIHCVTQQQPATEASDNRPKKEKNTRRVTI